MSAEWAALPARWIIYAGRTDAFSARGINFLRRSRVRPATESLQEREANSGIAKRPFESGALKLAFETHSTKKYERKIPRENRPVPSYLRSTDTTETAYNSYKGVSVPKKFVGRPCHNSEQQHAVSSRMRRVLLQHNSVVQNFFSLCLKFPPHFCRAKWPAHAQPIGPDGTCVT